MSERYCGRAESKFITASEFATRSHLSAAKVRRMMHGGELRRYLNPGRRGYVILETDATDWLERNRSNVIFFRLGKGR
jgi:hypothetical protein